MVAESGPDLPNLAIFQDLLRSFGHLISTWQRFHQNYCEIMPKSQRKNESLAKFKNESLTNCGQHPSASISIKILCGSKLLDSTIGFFNMLSMTSSPASRMLPYFGSPWPNRCFQEKRQLFGVWVSSARFKTDMYIDPRGTTLPQNSMVKKNQMFL